jgi:hypothetical protein
VSNPSRQAHPFTTGQPTHDDHFRIINRKLDPRVPTRIQHFDDTVGTAIAEAVNCIPDLSLSLATLAMFANVWFVDEIPLSFDFVQQLVFAPY